MERGGGVVCLQRRAGCECDERDERGAGDVWAQQRGGRIELHGWGGVRVGVHGGRQRRGVHVQRWGRVEWDAAVVLAIRRGTLLFPFSLLIHSGIC